LRLARRLTDINHLRQQNAMRLRESLGDLPGVQMIDEVPGGESVYSRFPIRVLDASTRDTLIESLRNAGIGATCSYPDALVDVAEISGKLHAEDQRQSGARAIARTIVTLPTHGYCPDDLGKRARQVVTQALAR
jgi:dTDP-4-amino-4,6-dideoxygalactose transaminase